MMIFHEIPTFYKKKWDFTENAKIFLRFPQLFCVFGPARPGCARPYKTNGILSLFRAFGCPWAHFPQNSTFPMKSMKYENHRVVLFSISWKGGGAIISQPAKPYPPMPYVTAFSGRRTYILCPPISYSSDKVGWTLARFPIDFLLKEMLESLRKGLNP